MNKNNLIKSIEEVLKNYQEYATWGEDRFGRRLCDFLEIDQLEQIGFACVDEKKRTKLEWSYKNILEQLKEDAEFGLEKAENQRGISSSLMHAVCESWCKIINKEDLINDFYNDYGMEDFKNILKFVNKEKKNNYE